MKKMKLSIAALALIISMAACNNPTTSSTTTTKNGKTTINISDDKTNAHVRLSGRIELNEDETAIAYMSPNGYLDYSNNGRELLAKSDEDGNIIYTLRDDGGKLDYNDAAGKNFVAQIIKEMNSYGVNLTNRIADIYQSQGVQGVLNEAAKMQKDDAKKNCYDFLLSKQNLSAEDRAAIAAQIATMEADHFKRDLLKKYADAFVNDQPGGINHILSSAAAIHSENQRCQVLEALVNTGEKTDAQWIAIIEAAKNISADGEKRNIMIKIEDKAPRTEAVRNALK